MHKCVENSFFQQNDTKINDFDEGVLILEHIFSEAMSFSKFGTFTLWDQKYTIEPREEFLRVPFPSAL